MAKEYFCGTLRIGSNFAAELAEAKEGMKMDDTVHSHFDAVGATIPAAGDAGILYLSSGDVTVGGVYNYKPRPAGWHGYVTTLTITVTKKHGPGKYDFHW